MVAYVERMLREGLELPVTFELRVERAHRALMPKQPGEAPPRSIVVKMSSYRMKEELLRMAWQTGKDYFCFETGTGNFFEKMGKFFFYIPSVEGIMCH